MHYRLSPAVIAATVLCLGLGTAARAQHDLKEFAQPALTDISASVKVIAKNDAELKKMGDGFVKAYELSDQRMQCKEPNFVRFEGKKGILRIRYLNNGSRRLMDVSPFHIHKTEDISKEPGKAESISDLGIITPAWVDRVEDRWVRTEERDGKKVEVFEFYYKEDPRAKHEIVVDPATKTILEHIAHHRAKKRPGFKKRLVYSDVKKINGVNVPTKATLLNGENRIAATMRYDGIRVNSGLPDKLFRF